MEFLCHDINVHVPHHVSSKIPWYNLRAATDSLRANWGQVRPRCTVLSSLRAQQLRQGRWAIGCLRNIRSCL